MKKWLVLAMAFALAACLAGCGGSQQAPSGSAGQDQQEQSGQGGEGPSGDSSSSEPAVEDETTYVTGATYDYERQTMRSTDGSLLLSDMGEFEVVGRLSEGKAVVRWDTNDYNEAWKQATDYVLHLGVVDEEGELLFELTDELVAAASPEGDAVGLGGVGNGCHDSSGPHYADGTVYVRYKVIHRSSDYKGMGEGDASYGDNAWAFVDEQGKVTLSDVDFATGGKFEGFYGFPSDDPRDYITAGGYLVSHDKDDEQVILVDLKTGSEKARFTVPAGYRFVAGSAVKDSVTDAYVAIEDGKTTTIAPRKDGNGPSVGAEQGSELVVDWTGKTVFDASSMVSDDYDAVFIKSLSPDDDGTAVLMVAKTLSSGTQTALGIYDFEKGEWVIEPTQSYKEINRGFDHGYATVNLGDSSSDPYALVDRDGEVAKAFKDNSSKMAHFDGDWWLLDGKAPLLINAETSREVSI